MEKNNSSSSFELKHKAGIPCSSTTNRAPMPNGQPSFVTVEKVPVLESSMIVLETSAGDVLFWLIPVDGTEDGSATATEHLMERCVFGMENFRFRVWICGIRRKWVFLWKYKLGILDDTGSDDRAAVGGRGGRRRKA